MPKAQDCFDRPQYTPWLAGLDVDPQWRGQGIGRALAARVEAEVRQMDLGEWCLLTSDAADFYTRLGWHLVWAFYAYPQIPNPLAT